MRGLPQILQTKDDWINAVSYVKETGSGKVELTKRLEALKGTKTRLVLKESAKKKKAEDQTPDDYEPELDQASPFVRSGLTDTEIENIITGLGV